MGVNLAYDDGQTPLDEDEKEGLKIKSISTQGELNEAEQLNIEEAMQWTISRKLKTKEILSEAFILALHKKMYGNTWQWAGSFRRSNKNIGADKLQITVALRNLLDDALYWIENNTFSAEETAIRVKHRIVSIHCFPNGNGRHSRLLADVIISHIFGKPVFTWGAIGANNDIRKQYLAAVRAADKGNFALLLAFCRS